MEKMPLGKILLRRLAEGQHFTTQAFSRIPSSPSFRREVGRMQTMVASFHLKDDLFFCKHHLCIIVAPNSRRLIGEETKPHGKVLMTRP